MKRVVFAVYKPFENKEEELLALIKVHFEVLLSQNLISDRKRIVLQANNNEIIEVFEWKSSEAIENAHSNETVMNLWTKFGEVCTYENLKSLKESEGVFPDFKILDF